jgi:hypothetical protein
MKLSEIIKELQEFYKENGDMECYYSHDDEGNGYQKVNYTATLRFLNQDERDEYEVESLYDEEDLDDSYNEKYNPNEFSDGEDDEDFLTIEQYKNNHIKVCLIN